MTTKQEIMKALEDLPDDATLEDAMERLYLLYKVERGMAQADTGQKVSQEEARRRSPQDWFRRRREVEEAYRWLASQVAHLPEVMQVRAALRDEVHDLLFLLAAEDFFEAESRIIPVVRQLISSFPSLTFDFLVLSEKHTAESSLSAWQRVIYERR